MTRIDLSISRVLASAFVLMLTGLASAQGIPLNYIGAGSEPPLITAAPAVVCAGTQYYDGSGALLTGTRTCGGAAACTTDGQGGCLVDGTNFRAAQMSAFTASSIKTGVTLAGVTGTASFTPADCTADGQVGCKATSSFSAVNMSLAIPANIKAGITIAGVTGGYPSATHGLHDNTGTTDLVSLAASVPAGAYEWWKSDGTRIIGTISDVALMPFGTSSQTFNASVYRQFTIPGESMLMPGNIKSGVNIFGVVGTYPSAMFPLSGGTGDADLDMATFDARIKSSSAFEWWDSAGLRHVSSGSPAIAPENIQSGIMIFGAVGAFGDNCVSDGDVNCMTTASLRSINIASFSPLDLRAGKSAGGVPGGIHFYKNMANTSLFDRSTGTGAVAGVDIFDTIDDSANGGAFPAQNPPGWYQVTGANWQRDASGDTGAGGGGVSDGICNGTEDCVYRDTLTGLWWSRANNSINNTWEAAIAYCDGLTTGANADWRMPTQKELIQAYIDGIRLLKEPSKLDVLAGTKYWAATTYSVDTTDRYNVQLDNGVVMYADVNNGGKTICVRP